MKTKKKMIPENHQNQDQVPDQGQGVAVVYKGLVLFACLLFLGGSNRLFSQEIQLAFNPGETVTYGAYYNWHFIWINAGEVVFTADTITNDRRKDWHLKARGKTFKAYDWLYTVRDTFESHLTYSDFYPQNFRRVINHSKKHSSHQYSFDEENELIYSAIKPREEPFFQDTLQYEKGTFDLLSSAYFFRSFQFSEMKKGQHIKFKILVDNKLEELFFTYLGKQEVKTREKERFRCHKISVSLLEGDFFPKGEHMKIWFTDDKNIMPVIVEAEITVGSVKAVLTGYEKLKYPLTSKIK